ncbi:MAG: septation protein SepH [Nocardioides sp.]
MVHLRLTRMSEDGQKLVLVSDARVEFTVDVDDRLRAAVAGELPAPDGDQAATGQLERKMDITLRPRDIQARIRAGETPETVAQVAGTTVDKVMPYAAPVLAERAHVAERAQRASVRRRPGDGSGASAARTLGEAVGVHLRARNVDPDTVSWDAWRREDGRWTLTGAFTSTSRVGAAHFSFDPPGNYVTADDEDAHWLLGEVADDVEAPAEELESTRDDLSDARRRRLSAVPADELPLGDDAIELVNEDHDSEVARTHPDETAALGAEAPVEAYLDAPAGTPAETEQVSVDGAAAVSDDDDEEEVDASDPRASEPPSRKPVKKTRGRASVPSWDEIMFGGPNE